jgi:magnesium chelatase family protein
VLFLDEFPEFDRAVIEALRQPLEERSIAISRARGTVVFPAQCILIASMNPCPCGKASGKSCACTAGILKTYRRRISGPIMDRLDIWLSVDKIDYDKLASSRSAAESSETIRSRVIAARQAARCRFESHHLAKRYNSELDARDLETVIAMAEPVRQTLANVAKKLGLSGRAFHRIIKVARTIADLAGEETLNECHILEAVRYRQKMPDS